VDFVHLHTHSDYSLLRSAAKISSLVARAKELGMSHLALTDEGSMFGALEFYKACRNADIVPILGCDFFVAPGSRHEKSSQESGNRYTRIVLLARNAVGYRNLLILSSKGYTEGFYYRPRIDRELLETHAEGLIALSGGISGEIPLLIRHNRLEEAEELARHYQSLYGPGGFYLELQDHGLVEERTVNEGLRAIHEATGIPLVAANEIFYVHREDAPAQDVLMCIGSNRKRDETDRFRFSTDEFYLKTGEEMAALFGDTPEALSNTRVIAESCNLEIDLPGPRFPDYQIPEEFDSPDSYLRHLAREGLDHRYSEVTPELEERLTYELDTIISMGFTGYFLIVWDFIAFARSQGIPVGPGRGSGAGSLVAYSLQITDIDPLKYGLLFERFLNPDRISMPDFDIDFCFERRGEVIDYVTRKYGDDRVGQIITFGTLKAKAVIRDVARVLDIPYAEADTIAKLVPLGAKTLQDAVAAEPELTETYEKGGIYAELIDISKKLEGLHRHASTHAAGIVIGQKPLVEYVPLYRDPKTGSISTQYTMDQLEDCGLVKMDFLGLKTLTLIENTEKLIRRRDDEFRIDLVSEEDKPTFELLGQGKSAAIFQFESQGMQGILTRARPARIEDLIALNALYRPGPMENIDQFVDSKQGRSPIRYPLPALERVLEETYGVIVYQEQVMEIVRIVAGFSLGQADILRRAMGKKKLDAMAKMKEEFLEGARNNGYTARQAEEIFELLLPFAGYGFNKSHAAAYSILAYKTAYLKANYSVEFMAANLTNEINDPKKFATYMEEARSMGIPILPPDINLSDRAFSVTDGSIVYGLIGIRNVGSAAVDEILRVRREVEEYVSFQHFLESIDLRVVNRKVVEVLIHSGLFDRFGQNRGTLAHNLDSFLEIALRRRENKRVGQASLFGRQEEDAMVSVVIEEVPELPAIERLQLERENLGFYFSGHPLDDYRKSWENSVTLNLEHLDSALPDKSYTLLGLLKSVRVIQTRKGGNMAFAVLEDFKGSVELVFFDEAYQSNRETLVDDAIVGIIGNLEERRGRRQIIVQDLRPPNRLEEREAREVHIRLRGSLTEGEDLYQLRALLFDRQGPCPVYLHVGSNGGESIVEASSQIRVSSRKETLEEIRRHAAVADVWRS
jgi:DNA polymerase III subunit alpha